MIVIVTPTIMDGAVVRWYHAVDVTNFGDTEPVHIAGEEVASASRNGVRVRGYLHDAEAILPAARAAYETLRANPGADLSHLATHHRRVLSGELVPVGAVSQHG